MRRARNMLRVRINSKVQVPGFTLVEVLVVVAVIALLIGLLLPALRQARTASRKALCLSNHRQLVAAWSVYMNDYGVFPVGDDLNFRTNEDWGWGGVDWYPQSISAPNNIPRMRPVNPYVGSDQHLTSHVAVFRCPLDAGVHEFGTGVNPLALEAAISLCPTPNTEYGAAGTSYRCNVWMYCKPGATNGWGGFPALPNYRAGQSPKDVQVSPSRFVLLQDTGPSNWAVSDPMNPIQMSASLAGEWWHGKGQAVHSFLDGSAREGKAGRNVCGWYSMHMVPLANPNFGWRWPGKQ